jgi:hypothetical protein
MGKASLGCPVVSASAIFAACRRKPGLPLLTIYKALLKSPAFLSFHTLRLWKDGGNYRAHESSDCDKRIPAPAPTFLLEDLVRGVFEVFQLRWMI